MSDGTNSWARLLEGNQRFVGGESIRRGTTEADRRELLSGQSPFAAILSCSDSRVPPEIVFNAGVGELFVVRSAGHVLDPVALGSLIYAVDHLRVPLVMILGHSGCGAVGAAVSQSRQRANERAEEPREAADALRPILDLIAPAIWAAGVDADVDAVTRQHVILTRDRLQEHPCIAAKQDQARVDVIGAFDDLASGRVTRLP